MFVAGIFFYLKIEIEALRKNIAITQFPNISNLIFHTKCFQSFEVKAANREVVVFLKLH